MSFPAPEPIPFRDLSNGQKGIIRRMLSIENTFGVNHWRVLLNGKLGFDERKKEAHFWDSVEKNGTTILDIFKKCENRYDVRKYISREFPSEKKEPVDIIDHVSMLTDNKLLSLLSSNRKDVVTFFGLDDSRIHYQCVGIGIIGELREKGITKSHFQAFINGLKKKGIDLEKSRIEESKRKLPSFHGCIQRSEVSQSITKLACNENNRERKDVIRNDSDVVVPLDILGEHLAFIVEYRVDVIEHFKLNEAALVNNREGTLAHNVIVQLQRDGVTNSEFINFVKRTQRDGITSNEDETDCELVDDMSQEATYLRDEVSVPVPIQNEEKDDGMCCICFEERKEWAPVPCGHMAYCGECINDISVCAICRTDITSRIKVFS